MSNTYPISLEHKVCGYYSEDDISFCGCPVTKNGVEKAMDRCVTCERYFDILDTEETVLRGDDPSSTIPLFSRSRVMDLEDAFPFMGVYFHQYKKGLITWERAVNALITSMANKQYKFMLNIINDAVDKGIIKTEEEG